MPPSEVHLIGEHHLDLGAVPRYQNAFSLLKPDVVTVEIDEERLELGQRSLREFLITEYGSLDNGITQFPNHNLNASIALRNFSSVVAAEIYRESHDQTKICLIDTLPLEVKQQLEWLYSSKSEEQTENHKQWANMMKTPEPLEIAILRVLGKERITASQMRGYTIPQAYAIGLDEIAITATEEELSQHVLTLDSWYYIIDRENLESTQDLETRDDQMVEKILQQDGRVVHAGGLLHLFGKYHNLYEKLKERKVNVKRHKLINYAHPGTIGSLLYRGAIRLEARSFRKISRQLKKDAKL